MEDDSLQVDVASADRLNEGGLEAGQHLAEQLKPSDEALMLLFYDSLKQPAAAGAPAMMNPSGPILQGLQKNGGKVPILGAGLLGDFGFTSSVQFTGHDVATQAAVAAALRGKFHVDWQITHGCAPNDGIYHTVTRAEGPVVFELDDRPAVEVINEMYGSEDWQKQLPVKRLTLGCNMGERFALEYQESDYVNRLILCPLPDQSGIVMFESDLEAGAEIQFMLRDSEAMIESARVHSRALLDNLVKEGKKPVWGLYVDCAGRSARFSDTLTEEAEEIQKAFNERGIPLFGFYSGVELAPLQGKSRGLDWTGVLTVFSQ